MSTLTQLKYLVAYYVRHHLEPQDFDEIGGEAAFIDEVSNEILDTMPTADLEKIRQFMVAGNVNEWIPLGQVIDAALNPLVEDDDDDGHDYVDRIQEEHEYKFGDWRL
jgi:hypothetical protein